jgi:hypothetical protein
MKLSPCLVKVSCHLPLTRITGRRAQDCLYGSTVTCNCNLFGNEGCSDLDEFLQDFLTLNFSYTILFLHVAKIGNEAEGNVYIGTEDLRTARIMYWDYACSCLGIKYL